MKNTIRMVVAVLLVVVAMEATLKARKIVHAAVVTEIIVAPRVVAMMVVEAIAVATLAR